MTKNNIITSSSNQPIVTIYLNQTNSLLSTLENYPSWKVKFDSLLFGFNLLGFITGRSFIHLLYRRLKERKLPTRSLVYGKDKTILLSLSDRVISMPRLSKSLHVRHGVVLQNITLTPHPLRLWD